MFINLNKKAQNTAEYVIVLGLIIAAIIAMQTYVKRGLQGRIKDVVDTTTISIDGTQGGDELADNIFSGGQYEPTYLSSGFDSSSDVQEDKAGTTGGGVTKTVSQDSSTRSGFQRIGSPTEGQ